MEHEDASLVGYLKYRGLEISVKKSQNPGRIVFSIDGDASFTEECVEDFYANKEVKIRTYVQCFKDVKTLLYNMRKLGV